MFLTNPYRFLPASGNALTDTYWNSVVLLLDMEDAVGTSNFIDKSTYANTFTKLGNPTIASGSIYGNSIGLFGASSTYLATSATHNFAGDFTIEFYIKDANLLSQTRMWFCLSGANDQVLSLYSVVPNIYTYVNSVSSSFSNAGLLTENHIAITRSGTTINYYINGVRKHQRTYLGTLSGVIKLGFKLSTLLSVNYIDEFRVTNGVARYTGDTYTVQTTPFPIG